MSLILNKIKKNKFLFVIIVIYILLAVFMPDKALQSVKNSMYYIKEMLVIMPVILILTSLIEAWVPKKTIENALGEDSGVKGPIFSLLLGSVSAGPIYAAFPVCKMLIKKGASVANIVVILSAWAVIKVPMLANESKFLGTKFMFIRWVLTTTSIFAMAYISKKIIKKEDIPLDNELENGRGDTLYVDERYCIGCGMCLKIDKNTFAIENKKARVTREVLALDESEKIKIAINKCPTKAIKYI